MTTVVTRTNLLPSPNDTAAVGAVAAKFTAHGSVASVAVTVSASVRYSRNAIRMTATSAPGTSLGARTSAGTNVPNIPAGTTFWFTADVFVPSNILGDSLTVAFRQDDPLDAAPVTMDAATPASQVLPGRDQWVTVRWKGTVNAGKTVTGIYLYSYNAANHTAGMWWETARWFVQASNASTAPPYFDGSSTDDLVLLETHVYDWTGTVKASPSTDLWTTYHQTLDLAWLDDQGAVRFTVVDIGPTQTVRMVGPNGRLVALRGYEDAEWHQGSTSGYGYHFEMPLGMWVQYAIADVGATYVGESTAASYIETPDNEAWLRDLALPMLSQRVTVVSTDDEIRQGRQTIITIAGRSNPLSLYDIRLSRSGTITLLVSNDPYAAWGDTEKEHMDLLLYSGRPLLFSMCMSKGFPPCYLAASDATYTKISSRANWLLKINYQEVDNPVDVGLTISPEVTWDMARSLPHPTALFQDWKDTFPTFIDLALNRPQGGTPEPPPEDVPE